MHIGLHQAEHVDQFEIGGLGIFVQQIIDLCSSVGDILPLFQYPLSSKGQLEGRKSTLERTRQIEGSRMYQVRLAPLFA